MHHACFLHLLLVLGAHGSSFAPYVVGAFLHLLLVLGAHGSGFAPYVVGASEASMTPPARRHLLDPEGYILNPKLGWIPTPMMVNPLPGPLMVPSQDNGTPLAVCPPSSLSTKHHLET